MKHTTVRRMGLLVAGLLVLTMMAAGCKGGKKVTRTPAEAAPEQISMDLQATIPITGSILGLTHNGGDGLKPGDTLSVSARGAVPEGGKIVVRVMETDWERELSPAGGDRFTGSGVIPENLPPGNYRIQALVMNADGEVVAEMLSDTGLTVIPKISACEALQNDLGGMIVYFDFDDYRLSDSAKNTLNSVYQAVGASACTQARLTIEGHCDERGTIEYNIALGQRRAETVRKYLAGLGMTRDRMTIKSYGEERPVDPGHSESAWRQNRRAEFRVSQ